MSGARSTSHGPRPNFVLSQHFAPRPRERRREREQKKASSKKTTKKRGASKAKAKPAPKKKKAKKDDDDMDTAGDAELAAEMAGKRRSARNLKKESKEIRKKKALNAIKEVRELGYELLSFRFIFNMILRTHRPLSAVPARSMPPRKNNRTVTTTTVAGTLTTTLITMRASLQCGKS